MTQYMIDHSRTIFCQYTSTFEMTNYIETAIIKDNVTKIANYAFKDWSYLKNITIPDSVTSIGKEAFCNCSGLTSVSLPDSVKEIGEFAFYNCMGIKSITIPDSVTNIGNDASATHTAFSNVFIKSHEITFPLNHPKYVMPDYAFDRRFYKKENSFLAVVKRRIPYSIKQFIKHHLH